MSDPRDHSQSEFEEAQRFWGEYARRTRPGAQRSGAATPSEGQNGHSSAASQAHECLDWCPICRTADLLRASAPPELRDQVQGLQRDALVTLRALLDAYIERGGEGSGGPRSSRDSAVEDIPID
jgi:hypothetical protein